MSLATSEVLLHNWDMTRRMPMATFIRDYANVLDDVDSTGDTVVLDRRAGKPSLVLSPQARVLGEQHAVSTVSHLLTHVLADASTAKAVLVGLGDEYPWVAFLPEPEQHRFMSEVLTTLRACASIGRFAAYESLIDSWAATAEVWSDPDLARALSTAAPTPVGAFAVEPAPPLDD